MDISQLLSDRLQKTIYILNKNYSEAAFILNANPSELFPDNNEVYVKFYPKRNSIKKYAHGIQVAINIFLEGWPVVEYLKKIHFLCRQKSMFEFVYSKLSVLKQSSLMSAFLNLMTSLTSQMLLIGLFHEQQYMTEFMVSKWNKLQNDIFNSSVEILTLCSEVHLKETDDKLKGVLMSPTNALKWFDFLFGKKSVLINHNPDQKQKILKQQRFYKLLKFIACCLFSSSVILIFLGNSTYRDIYILLLISAVATIFYIRHQEKSIQCQPEENLNESKEWLANAPLLPAYSANLTFSELDDDLGSFPGFGA